MPAIMAAVQTSGDLIDYHAYIPDESNDTQMLFAGDIRKHLLHEFGIIVIDRRIL